MVVIPNHEVVRNLKKSVQICLICEKTVWIFSKKVWIAKITSYCKSILYKNFASKFFGWQFGWHFVWILLLSKSNVKKI